MVKPAAPRPPFHVALHNARVAAYLDPALLAGPAGVTVAIWLACELGHAPASRAVYAEACKRFPQLSSYPMPPPDPCIITPVTHPAVMMEYARTQQFFDLAKRCNFGGTHRGIVRQLLLLAIGGGVSPDDINRHF